MADLTIADVEAAARRIEGRVHRTPLFSSRALSEFVAAEVRLKPECLQRAGAFKIRGAMNRLLAMTDDERAKGVVAFSSGNHAQAVALAARETGARAVIAMPEDSAPHKVAATRAYGAEVVTEGVSTATRDTVARRLAERSGATVVPPFDDPFIVAGQGTVGLEIAQDWADVETIVVPTGGGGLLAGVALAATSRRPGIKVYGVEPEAGDDVRRSIREGRIVSIDPPKTIADGARTLSTGEIPFSIIRERVTDVVTVPDEALLAAMKVLALRAKLVVEPTGALAMAAVLENRIPSPGRVAVVLSGGNVSAEMLARALGS